jgi:hypothetical protein
MREILYRIDCLYSEEKSGPTPICVTVQHYV